MNWSLNTRRLKVVLWLVVFWCAVGIPLAFFLGRWFQQEQTRDSLKREADRYYPPTEEHLIRATYSAAIKSVPEPPLAFVHIGNMSFCLFLISLIAAGFVWARFGERAAARPSGQTLPPPPKQSCKG
jgi:hypothetical protein